MKAKITFAMQDGEKALQEVFRWLEHSTYGDKYIAWYGQARAIGLNHAKALQNTIDHFGLEGLAWFERRIHIYASLPPLPEVLVVPPLSHADKVRAAGGSVFAPPPERD